MLKQNQALFTALPSFNGLTACANQCQSVVYEPA